MCNNDNVYDSMIINDNNNNKNNNDKDVLNIYDNDYVYKSMIYNNNKSNNDTDKEDDNHRVPESTPYYVDLKNKNLFSGY